MPRDTPLPLTDASSAPLPQADRRICVIANPGSGRRNPELFDTIRTELHTANPDSTLMIAKKGKDLPLLARQALKDRYDVICAAGGDGTICAVASELFHARAQGLTPPALGVIPLGTFNYVARSLGVNISDPATAARQVLTGRPRPLAIGEVNGNVFLNNASLGAYPAILDQREDIYRLFGRSRVAAYWSVLRTLATLRRPLSLRIEVDGQTIRRKSPLAFVAASAYQVDQFALPGADAIRNGQFAVYVAPDTGRFRLILSALRLAGRTAQLDRDMEMVTAQKLTIHTRQKRRLIARDGEKDVLRGPFTFQLHPEGLQVICPDTPA